MFTHFTENPIYFCFNQVSINMHPVFGKHRYKLNIEPTQFRSSDSDLLLEIDVSKKLGKRLKYPRKSPYSVVLHEEVLQLYKKTNSFMGTFQRLAESLFALLKLKDGYFEETPFSGCFLPLFFNNPIVLISCKCQTVECLRN